MQIRNHFWILSNLCLNLHNHVESVAILLDSAILEYSRVKPLGVLAVPPHTQPPPSPEARRPSVLRDLFGLSRPAPGRCSPGLQTAPRDRPASLRSSRLGRQGPLRPFGPARPAERSALRGELSGRRLWCPRRAGGAGTVPGPRKEAAAAGSLACRREPPKHRGWPRRAGVVGQEVPVRGVGPGMTVMPVWPKLRRLGDAAATR